MQFISIIVSVVPRRFKFYFLKLDNKSISNCSNLMVPKRQNWGSCNNRVKAVIHRQKLKVVST